MIGFRRFIGPIRRSLHVPNSPPLAILTIVPLLLQHSIFMQIIVDLDLGPIRQWLLTDSV